MLLTFDENGCVQFTRNPTALKLVEGVGHLQVTRMSDIRFHRDAQKYYIVFLTGEFMEEQLRWRHTDPTRQFILHPTSASLEKLWLNFVTEHSPALCDQYVVKPEGMLEPVGPVMFRSYEDAVAIEIAFIDFLREQGVEVQ